MFAIISYVDLTLSVEVVSSDRQLLIDMVKDAAKGSHPYNHWEEADSGEIWHAKVYMGDIWVAPVPCEVNQLLQSVNQEIVPSSCENGGS